MMQCSINQSMFFIWNDYRYRSIAFLAIALDIEPKETILI